eukprot:TRINITY_DN6262_c0_g1_i10.p1 TRINITY_DN6262_c0_g1~~TRINITY_DN6262_c0_g1_i10.p1  ORF type:complete len:575 (-),score=44.72 TRINITY_DN6262_c0_g1_i10:495-2219(-)
MCIRDSLQGQSTFPSQLYSVSRALQKNRLDNIFNFDEPFYLTSFHLLQRNRWKPSTRELAILKETYETSPYPSKDEKNVVLSKIEESLGFKPKYSQITRWFQHYREKQVKAGQSSVRKTSYTKFTYEELKILTSNFKKNPYPSFEEIKTIGEELNVIPAKVENWFKHYRRALSKQGLFRIKKRKHFKDSDISYVRRCFAINPKPSKETYNEIAEVLKCDPSHIKSWFSNKRKREKKLLRREQERLNNLWNHCEAPESTINNNSISIEMAPEPPKVQFPVPVPIPAQKMAEEQTPGFLDRKKNASPPVPSPMVMNSYNPQPPIIQYQGGGCLPYPREIVGPQTQNPYATNFINAIPPQQPQGYMTDMNFIPQSQPVMYYQIPQNFFQPYQVQPMVCTPNPYVVWMPMIQNNQIAGIGQTQQPMLYQMPTNVLNDVRYQSFSMSSMSNFHPDMKLVQKLDSMCQACDVGIRQLTQRQTINLLLPLKKKQTYTYVHFYRRSKILYFCCLSISSYFFVVAFCETLYTNTPSLVSLFKLHESLFPVLLFIYMFDYRIKYERTCSSKQFECFELRNSVHF